MKSATLFYHPSFIGLINVLLLVRALSLQPTYANNDTQETNYQHHAQYARVSGRIKLPKDELEPQFFVMFIPIDKATYDVYQQEFSRLLDVQEKVCKQMYPDNSYYEERDELLFKIHHMVERRTIEHLRRYSVEIHKSTPDMPFEISLEKGEYVVHIWQKGAVYVKLIMITKDMYFDLEEEDFYSPYPYFTNGDTG